MFENRPIIKILKTPLERLFNVVAVVAFISVMVYLLVDWSSIPQRIPTHFNAGGDPDGWSGKGSILILPIVGMVLWIGLTVLERFPHVYNYLRLTAENAEFQYKNATRMINVLKNSIVLFFVFITWQSVQVANGVAEGLGQEFVFIFLAVIFGSTAFFLIQSLRKR